MDILLAVNMTVSTRIFYYQKLKRITDKQYYFSVICGDIPVRKLCCSAQNTGKIIFNRKKNGE